MDPFIPCQNIYMSHLKFVLLVLAFSTVTAKPYKHVKSKHVSHFKKLFSPAKDPGRRNDVIRKISSKEELIRGQLYAGTDINTGYGIGLTGASLSVINMLPYVHAFDTETGMPYVCDPYKKKPDEKIDNRWTMKVPPCPDFKKCLFPWKEAKDCETKVDNNQAKPSRRRWVVKPFLIPVLIPAGKERT